MIREAIDKAENKEELSPRLIGRVATEMVTFDDINIKEINNGYTVLFHATDVTVSEFNNDLEDFIAWMKKFGSVNTELNTKNMTSTIKLTYPQKDKFTDSEKEQETK